MSTIKNQKWIGLLLATVGAIFWGASGTIAAYMFKTTHVSSIWVVYTRLISAGILLLISYILMNHKSIFNIWSDHSSSKRLLAFSFLGMMPSQLCYFLAIRFVNPATATVLQFTSPIFIIIYLSINNHQLPNRRNVFSIGLALMGTFLLATRGEIDSLSISALGLIFGIGAGMTNAIYTIIPVQLLHKHDAKLVCGWAMFIGSFPLLPFAIPQAPHVITSAFIYEMLFIIIIGTMLAYLFFVASINYLNPAITGVLGAFEPLSATILSVLILGLTLHPVDIIGGGLILFMAIMQSLPDKHSLTK